MAREREGVRETPGGGTRRQMALPVGLIVPRFIGLF